MKERVTYASQILYVGPTGEGGQLGESEISGVSPTQLHHIKYIEHAFEPNIVHAYQYGTREPVGEVTMGPVDLTLEFQYNLADAQNEKWLGFNLSPLNTSMVSGFLEKENDVQNFYILTTEHGDAVTKDSNQEFLNRKGTTVTAIGNGVVENYNISATIDSIPEATVTVRADNLEYNTTASGIKCPNDINCSNIGSVVMPAPREDDLEVDALRSHYLTLYFNDESLPQGGYALPSKNSTPTISSCSLKSFEIDVPLPRRINKRLGNKYPVSKDIEYPSEIEFSCKASTKDIISGSLMDIFCSESNNVMLEMNNPYTEEPNILIKINDLRLDSQISEHSLITQEFVDLKFNAPLGAEDAKNMGIFMSGVADQPQYTYYGTTSGQVLNQTKALR